MPKSVNPLIARRKSSQSPLSSAQRVKPGVQKTEKEERLEDSGLVRSLAPRKVQQDIVSLIRYIQSHTFEDIPDRAAGMNSERISEVLRFRKRLPPIVSVAHLLALSRSPTETERELARETAKGSIRKVTIPGRGKGGSTIGEGVVLSEDWKRRVQEEEGLDESLRDRYISLMDRNPISSTVAVSIFSSEEIRDLMTAGYLTIPSLPSDTNVYNTVPGASSISKAGFSAPSGSLAAIGGHGAINDSGGGGSALAAKDMRRMESFRDMMNFSLPSTGLYLRLLTEARLHIVFLLKQLSPRHREATLDILREKWDGNVSGDALSAQKRMRGEWAGVLPGRAKRWRDFYGLEFDWILAECVGSGLMELFDTGAVGVAVRGT
ncbi:hypothetical protein TI39_contig4154g00018 [Zymoseptoria brevis]|uniref:Serine-threonine protein kinase 19 n=1 Tax=Zymoseptoria brevis TaxID=1047168 RepID=A0A0F4GF99_9PEZI|nr:hypothetical protein TI39_contig4154g00018 [Zymoseptoria brevis]